MKERFCRLLLALLGFAAAGCSPTESGLSDDDFIAEYGVPSVEFTIKGRVVDADKRAIANIHVRSEFDGWYGDTGDSEARSADDGTFEIRDDYYGFSAPCNLIFTDTDGEENGGQFASRTVTVEFSKDDRTGSGSWVSYYSKDIGDVELELAADESDDDETAEE